MKKTIFTISSLPIWTMGKNKGMRVIHETHQAFVQHGWTVHYFFSHTTSNKTSSRGKKGLHIHNFFVPFPTIKLKFLCTIASKIYLLVFTVAAYKKMLKHASEHSPDLIYAQTLYAGLPGYLIGKRLQIPVVYRDFGCWDLLEKVTNKLKRLIIFDRVQVLRLPFSHYILTNDGTQYDQVAELLNIPKEKISFLRNGVQKDIYLPNFKKDDFYTQHHIKPRTSILLSVTRLMRYKGVHEIIDACTLIKKNNSNFHLFIVGDGPEEDALKQQVEIAGLTKQVTFVGAIDHEGLKTYYTAADIYISMYAASNLGNPLFEAMSSKNAILAKNTGATAEVIHHKENGILIPRNNSIQALSEALNDLLQDKNMQIQLQESAYRDFHHKFQSWKKRTDTEIEILEQLMQ